VKIGAEIGPETAENEICAECLSVEKTDGKLCWMHKT
jgi:hypothetical protein